MPSRPISTTLEADLRATVRKHGVVAWLDADGHYTGFGDRLSATQAEHPEQVTFAVLTYHGRHLTRMPEPEGLAAGMERTAFVATRQRLTEGRVNALPALTAPPRPTIRTALPVGPRFTCATS